MSACSRASAWKPALALLESLDMESLQSDLPLGVMPWSMGWFLLETLLGLGSITLQLENHDPTVIPKYQPNYFVFFQQKQKRPI
jgi:hypothetical protein